MEQWNYETFLMDLRKFQNKIKKEFNEDLKKFKISSTHIGVLMLLKNQKTGYSMSELSRLTKVDNALMTRNIKELEKIDYVYRDQEEHKKRKYHICLTESGWNVAKKLEQIIKTKQKNFEESFTKEEQDVLCRALQIIAQKFMKIEKEDKEC